MSQRQVCIHRPPNVTRAMALIRVLDIFRVTGTPVDRELANSALPEHLEAFPDEYISTAPACGLIKSCQKIERIPDLGWYAYKALQDKDVNAHFQKHSHGCVTLLEFLHLLQQTMHLESNYLACKLTHDDMSARFEFADPCVEISCGLEITEWSRIMSVVRVIQKVMGDDWRPTRLNFISKFEPDPEAREYFRNAVIRTGHHATAVEFPPSILSSLIVNREGPSKKESSSFGGLLPPNRISCTLRTLLRPYMSSGRPSLELAAEMCGLSRRTLQRSLAAEGVSFSHVLDQCALELSLQLLKDPKNKMIDVAYSVGYQDPSHFARAFRRLTGVTPSRYRAQTRS